MAVPYTFGTATAAIPLSQLDSNFATAITIGNTAVQLGNTVTTLNNLTLANVTISSGNVTITNVAVTTANVSGTANVSTMVIIGNESVGGNTTVTGNISANNATLTTSLTLSGGTANGVAYLNGSKALTTGTGFVFDGSNVGIGTASPGTTLDVQGTVAGNFYQNLYNGSSNSAAQTLYVAKSFGASGVQFGQQKSTANGIINVIDSAALTFGTGNTERMRINAGAPILCLAGGSTTATGTGIAFPATQSASTDVNTLDDYEEGSWSPAITSSIGTITTVSAGGQYRKIGSLVVAQFQYAITNNGTGSGSIIVNGLPFAGTVNTSAGTIREIAVVGFTGSSYLSGSTSMILVQYNNLYPGGTNYNVLGTVSYQSTS